VRISDRRLAQFLGAMPQVTAAYAEGILAGLAGAATIAGWFFILDAVRGKPFYTPTVLGAALFHRGAAPWLDAVPNLEMVLMFSWIHGMVFAEESTTSAFLLRARREGWAIADRAGDSGPGIRYDSRFDS